MTVPHEIPDDQVLQTPYGKGRYRRNWRAFHINAEIDVGALLGFARDTLAAYDACLLFEVNTAARREQEARIRKCLEDLRRAVESVGERQAERRELYMPGFTAESPP